MKKFVAMMLVVMMALSLVACGGGASSDPAKAIVGSWELDDAEGEETKQAVALMKMFGMTMVFEFKADGTGTMTSSMGDENEVTEFNYEINGDQIVIDGSPANFKIDGKKLHIDVDGEMLIFKKK